MKGRSWVVKKYILSRKIRGETIPFMSAGHFVLLHLLCTYLFVFGGAVFGLSLEVGISPAGGWQCLAAVRMLADSVLNDHRQASRS